MTGGLKTVDREIGHVADLTGPELIERWQKIFKAPPPKGIKRGLLERAVTYRIQAQAYGGLKSATRKRLLAIAEAGRIARGKDSAASSAGVHRKGAAGQLKPGARLIREWNGAVYTVEVVAGGYVWNGENWTSLSAVARAITGARWSGPRFFGR